MNTCEARLHEAHEKPQLVSDVATTRSGPSLQLYQRTFWLVSLLCAFGLVWLAWPGIAGAYYLQRGAEALARAQQNTAAADPIGPIIDDLERATRLLPSDPTPLRHLARAYTIDGQPASAVSALEQAFALQPTSLLIRKELTIAYRDAAQFERAVSLGGEIGYTPDRMVAIGDSYLEVGSYKQAIDWYDTALLQNPELETTLAFARLMAMIATGDSRAQEVQPLAEQAIPGFTPVPVIGEPITVSGSMLRWVLKIDDVVSFGTPLNHPYGGSDGIFYWQGRATLLLAVERPGQYRLRAVVRQSSPPPVEMGFGVNGLRQHMEQLPEGDDSWDELEIDVVLSAGLQTIDVWFLNNIITDGVDRDGAIRSISLEPLEEA